MKTLVVDHDASAVELEHIVVEVQVVEHSAVVVEHLTAVEVVEHLTVVVEHLAVVEVGNQHSVVVVDHDVDSLDETLVKRFVVEPNGNMLGAAPLHISFDLSTALN